MILLANYADKTFANAQKYNSYTAKKFGKVDEVIEYGPEKIDSKFIDKNKAWFVVGNSQIGKYGLWRPLILEDAYSKIQEDDYLIYADSGTYFINDIHYLTNFMKERHLNVLVFSIPFVEKDWTKRDVFIQLDADQEDIIYSNQRMSTCFVVRKSKEGTELIEQYKKIAVEHPELFTDQENVMGKENYFGFIQNRHNQSVLSVLTKKMGIDAYRDPTEYGVHPKLYAFYDLPRSAVTTSSYEDSEYPQILVQHRRGNVTQFVKVCGYIRSKCPYFISGAIIKVATIRQCIKRGKELRHV